MSITDEKLEEIKAANAGQDLHLLENPATGDQIVCKSPGVEWVRFRSESEGKPYTQRMAAAKTLISLCAVYPSKAEVEAMLDARPGLKESWWQELGEIAGSSARATHRKL